MSRIHVTVVLLKSFWKTFSVNSISSKKRLTVCPKHLHALVLKFAGVSASLRDIRDVSVMSLSQVDTKLYGLHSLRIGGASAAANNDLQDRVIKKHGRQWKSEKAKDTYSREDIQHQLLVTLNIGI